MKLAAIYPDAGTYVIRNTVANGVYVGGSINVPERLASHQKMLERGRHHNPPLWKAWNKYGRDAFTFEQVDRCDSLQSMMDAEQRLIHHWREQQDVTLYNVILRSTSPLVIHPNHPEQRLLSLRTACRLAGVQPYVLQHLAKTGEVWSWSKQKYGKVYFDLADIERWLVTKKL